MVKSGAAALLTTALSLTACGENNQAGETEPVEAPGAAYVEPDAEAVNSLAAEGESEVGLEGVGAELVTDEPLAAAELEAGVGEEAAAGEGQVFGMAAPGMDAVRIERTGDTEVRAGEQFSYQIRITNTTDMSLYGVTVRELTPPGFQIAESSPRVQAPSPADMAQVYGYAAPGGPQAQMQQGSQNQMQQGQPPQGQPNQQAQRQQRPNQQNQAQPARNRSQAQNQGQNQGGMQVWRLGMLAPDESRTIRVTGAAASEGALRSCLMVDYKPAVCTVVNVVQPELTLQMAIVDGEGNPIEQAYLCDEVYLAYRLINSGTAATEPAVIRTQLPQGVTFQGNSTVSLEAGAIEPDEEFTERIPLEIEQPRRLALQATATTGELTVQSDRHEAVLMKPDLALQLDGPQREYLGRPLTYRVRVRNTSPFPALNTAVTVELPEAATNVSVSTQQIEQEGDNFLIGRLEPGQSRTFALTFDVDDPGQVPVRASAEAYCAPADQQSQAAVQTQVVGIPAALIELVDNNDPVQVGNATVYQIAVKNQGTAPDMNVRLQAQVPQGMQFVHGEGDTQVTMQNGTINFAPIAQLDPGQVVTWKIQLQAQNPGTARFNVRMISEANQKPIVEQEPTTLY